MESAHRYFRIGAPLILDWAHRLTGIRSAFALDWILSSIDSFIPQALLKVEFFKSGVLFGWLYLKDPGFDWH